MPPARTSELSRAADRFAAVLGTRRGADHTLHARQPSGEGREHADRLLRLLGTAGGQHAVLRQLEGLNPDRLANRPLLNGLHRALVGALLDDRAPVAHAELEGALDKLGLRDACSQHVVWAPKADRLHLREHRGAPTRCGHDTDPAQGWFPAQHGTWAHIAQDTPSSLCARCKRHAASYPDTAIPASNPLFDTDADARAEALHAAVKDLAGAYTNPERCDLPYLAMRVDMHVRHANIRHAAAHFAARGASAQQRLGCPASPLLDAEHWTDLLTSALAPWCRDAAFLRAHAQRLTFTPCITHHHPDGSDDVTYEQFARLIVQDDEQAARIAAGMLASPDADHPWNEEQPAHFTLLDGEQLRNQLAVANTEPSA